MEIVDLTTDAFWDRLEGRTVNVNELVKTAEMYGAAKPAEPLTLPEPPPDLEVEHGWRVRTVEDADWALSRIGECEAEGAEIDRLAELAIARIEARRQKLKAKAERGAAWFRAEVERWADSDEGRKALLRGGKAKSRTLLHGRIGWRSHGGRLSVTDKEALAEWAQGEGPEFARITVAPEMKAIQQRCKQTGEVPPGTNWEPQRDELYVEAAAPEGAPLVKGDE